jgi:hypothetical protein
MPSLIQTSQKSHTSFVVPLLLLTLFCTAILWILNILAIVQGPWASILSILFTVLSILIALLQWLFPLERITSSPTLSQSMTPPHGTFTSQDLLLFDMGRRKGALLLRVPKQIRGASIHLYQGFEPLQTVPERAANVVERSLAGSLCFVAIFPSLHPGNYTLRVDGFEYQAQVTVLANQLAEIDWRWTHRPWILSGQQTHKRQIGGRP